MALENRIALIVIGLPQRLLAYGSLLRRFARKAALFPLLLPFLIYAVAQFTLHQSALSVLDKAIATLPAKVQFRFDQIDTDFDGGVDILGATLLLPGMSLPLQFQTLRLVNSDWRELSGMASALDLGLLPQVIQVEFTLAETELSRLVNSSLLPVDAARMALGCFQPHKLVAATDVEEAALFSGRFDYRFDAQSEYLNARLQLSADERYRLDLNADLDIGAPQLHLAKLDTIGLGGADISYLNLGSQSDLLRDCGATGRAGLVEGVYVAKQSAQVKRRLSQQGWMASTELELAYQDYLFLPLQLNLQLTAAKAVSLHELTHSPVSWGSFAVRIGLNTPQADREDLTWLPSANQWLAGSGAKVLEHRAMEQPAASVESGVEIPPSGVTAREVMAKIAPVPLSTVEVLSPDVTKRETTEQEPRSEPKKSPISEAQLQQQLQQTVRYKPSYKPVSVTELSGLLGSPMRLTTRNGRQMEGVLERIEFDRLQLRSEISQGIAILPVRLDIISAMQAYF